MIETHTTHRPLFPAVTAAAGAAIAAVTGAIQAVRPYSDDPLVDPQEHLLLALFAATLLLWVPAYLRLGAVSGTARVAAAAVVVGLVSLAAAATASNLHNEDYPWFPAVAVPANGLWAVGSIVLAIVTYRARTLPRPLAAALPVIWLTSIVVSQVGGNLVAGALWAAIAWHWLTRRDPDAPSAT